MEPKPATHPANLLIILPPLPFLHLHLHLAPHLNDQLLHNPINPPFIVRHRQVFRSVQYQIQRVYDKKREGIAGRINQWSFAFSDTYVEVWSWSGSGCHVYCVQYWQVDEFDSWTGENLWDQCAKTGESQPKQYTLVFDKKRIISLIISQQPIQFQVNRRRVFTKI
jgi:hypothetical protein